MTLAPPSTESRYPPPVIDTPVFPASSRQVGGSHYAKLSPQPWDVVDAWNLSFYEGNVLKYLARWKAKGGVEDLEKARHYLDRLIEKERACKP